MCLILTAWHAHPAYALVVAANRDEFYDRPAAPLAWWSDAPTCWPGATWPRWSVTRAPGWA